MGLRMDDIHAPTVASGPTSQPTTNGTSKKLTFTELAAQKDKLEAELSALGSVLDSHGVNMNTSLTTFDGYPRADIDVAQVRTTRARIIRLKNDHKEVMKQLEEAVYEHFATNKVPADASASVPRTTVPSRQSNGSSDIIPHANTNPREPAFARVNAVSPNSPAESAGLLAGDQIVRFGPANWTNHEQLRKVAQVVQQNEGRPITVKVHRLSEGPASPQDLNIQLTPRSGWGGRGLLGCHLLPM